MFFMVSYSKKKSRRLKDFWTSFKSYFTPTRLYYKIRRMLHMRIMHTKILVLTSSYKTIYRTRRIHLRYTVNIVLFSDYYILIVFLPNTIPWCYVVSSYRLNSFHWSILPMLVDINLTKERLMSKYYSVVYVSYCCTYYLIRRIKLSCIMLPLSF